MPIEDNRPPKKHNIQKRNLKSYNKEELAANVININWPEVLSLEKMDVNHSFENYDKKINEIIDLTSP